MMGVDVVVDGGYPENFARRSQSVHARRAKFCRNFRLNRIFRPRDQAWLWYRVALLCQFDSDFNVTTLQPEPAVKALHALPPRIKRKRS